MIDVKYIWFCSKIQLIIRNVILYLFSSCSTRDCSVCLFGEHILALSRVLFPKHSFFRDLPAYKFYFEGLILVIPRQTLSFFFSLMPQDARFVTMFKNNLC